MPVLSILLACLVIASPLLAQQTPALVTQSVDNSARTTLPGNVHPMARAEFDQGEAPPDLPFNRMLLVLKRSDQQEITLRRLIENQQYKKSSSYHQWLTPEEFGAKFGPADSDIEAVTNWLQSSGFQVTQVSNGRTVIEFSGTAGQVKQAFGAAIHKFVVNGESHWANVSDPSIPTALAPVVAGVNSLHNFLKKAQNIRVGTYSEKTRQITSPRPGVTATNGCPPGESTCYPLGPYDFATIYNLLPLWTAATPINGAGQTIAIVGRTDINPNDAPTFWSLFGLGVNGVPIPTLNIIYNGPNPGITGDLGEADIDTQWSGAAAPGATIDFVASESTETDDGVDLSAFYIVDNNLAPIMSESYGTCEADLGQGGVGFYNALWEQAAAQGITAMVSAGDNGSAGCDDDNTNSPAKGGLQVNGLASTWFNVAVGGTDFNQYNTWTNYWNSTNDPTTQESAKGYIPETSWNDSCTNAIWVTLGWGSNAEAVCNNLQLNDLFPTGGSGGASTYWLKPPWQTGAGVPNDSARDMPNVSLFSSSGFMSSFYLICQTDITGPSFCSLNNLAGYGGTSVASPAFAGIMALVNQKTGSLQGSAGHVLYNLSSHQPTAFHDVPAGSTNAMPCVPTSPNCTTTPSSDSVGVLTGYATTTAYDLATGLGSVNAANLVNDWNSVTFTPTTTTLSLTVPANTTHGTAVPVTVSVASSSATGDVALLVSPKPGTPGIDWNTLKDGTVTWSTNLLPGGTYNVIAHYEGDTTYGGSYSSPSASITVKPESSVVVMPGVDVGADQTAGLPIYASSVVYGTGAGASYLLRADVYNSQDTVCTTEVLGEIACPTGTITFTDNGAALDGGTFKLNSFGYTEDQGIQLTGSGGTPPGTHVLVASYSGDASYKASTATTTVTVTKAPTTIGAITAPSTATTGQQFNISATVNTNSNGAAPTGTVSFFASGTLLVVSPPAVGTSGGNDSLNVSVSASIATSGTYAITASYSGDGNYASSAQTNPVSVVVSPAPVDFNWTSTGSTSHTVLSGQTTLAYTFTAAPTGGTFPVAVQFSCTPSSLPDSTVSCQFSPSATIAAGSGATQVSMTITTTGPYTGTGTQLRRRADNRAPWLPLALPLAGIVMVGLAGRKISKYSAIAGLCVSLGLLGLLFACGGGGGSSPPPATNVTVSAGVPASVFPNDAADGWPSQTAQFTATVTNNSNTAVTWAVVGGSANGTISASGLYTAPTAVAGLPPAVTVTATSVAAPTASGYGQETLYAATVPGTYNNIFVTATEGTILYSDPVTLVVQ
jgi:hypothetical protein